MYADHPSREEFSELIYYISELKHQYTNKIDEQSTKINEQSMIIEELLWQIRELSDKLRQINQWKSEVDKVISDSRMKFNELSRSCICRYENHIPKNRIINSQNKTKVLNNDNNSNDDDDVYETIEFSDSSHHIYTEPFKTESNYGALRKVSIKTVASNSKQTASLGVNNNKRSVNSSTSASKKGIKKSSRVRNLSKYPATQDVSKAADSDSDSVKDVVDGCKVQLRTKSPSSREVSGDKSRRMASNQMNALVSDIGVGFIRNNRENLESFIPQRDVSGILINFGCSKSEPSKKEAREPSY